MPNEIEDSAELIVEIARSVEDVGSGKGNAIAEDFENDYRSFRDADVSRLLAIRRSTGSQILTDIQAEVLVAEKANIPAEYGLREAWIFWIGREFLMHQVSHISTLTLDKLDINPLLARVLDLKTPRQILEFNLYQSITRSIVTAWGTTVEKLLKHSGADPCERLQGLPPGSRPDAQKLKDGIVYVLQVKSGPNTMNVETVQGLNKCVEEYRSREPEKKVLLAMTYGKRERISTQIRNYLVGYEDMTLIGRELWDFISGERDFHRKLFGLLDRSSNGVLGYSFSDLLERQLDSLVGEWDGRYQGWQIEKVLENYM